MTEFGRAVAHERIQRTHAHDQLTSLCAPTLLLEIENREKVFGHWLLTATIVARDAWMIFAIGTQTTHRFFIFILLFNR